MKICATCEKAGECRKGMNPEDFCLDWRGEFEPEKDEREVVKVRLFDLVMFFPKPDGLSC
jgi:hypothetical protein